MERNDLPISVFLCIKNYYIYRLHNEIKDLQAYKEKVYRELCRIRDEQKTFGKIKVNVELL